VLALADLKAPIVPAADRGSAQIRWLSVQEVEAVAKPNEFVFLGEDDTGAPIFASNFLPWQIAQRTEAVEALKPLLDLRSLALQRGLSDAELLVTAQARAILGWNGVTRCCARCGTTLRSADAGWRRQCPACGLDTYPRTDPAVIMLITD